MGIIRKTLIVGVCVALIPAEQHDRDRLQVKAQQAAQWTATFCDRNKQTCTHGKELWATLVDKAGFAASSAYDIALQQFQSGEPQTSRWSKLSQPPVSKPAGTLTPWDLVPIWRGPGVKSNATQ